MFDDFWSFGGQRRQQENQDWTVSLNLHGFRSNEVQIERASDNSTVKVHAKRDHNDDYSEVKRTIQVPHTVDRDQLDVDFSRDGLLIIRAPYRRQQQLQHRDSNSWAIQNHGGNNRAAMMPHASQELRDLDNNLWNLTSQSFPGSMHSNIVRAEDGDSKLQVDFDLSGYKPEEVTVNHEGDLVSVEARHETKTTEGSSFKHFKQVFTLPKNVNLEKLNSRLLSDGRLRLEAPCSVTYPQQHALTDRDIPVNRKK